VKTEELEEIAAGPVPAIAGTFAIYEDGHGGYVLVTETEQHGIIRKHIPGALLKLANKLSGGFGGFF
jgi:hypothetical protein